MVSSDAQHAESSVSPFLCRFLHCADVSSVMFSSDYGATYSCITSPKYSENYAPDGSCVIKLAYLLTLDMKDFGLR